MTYWKGIVRPLKTLFWCSNFAMLRPWNEVPTSFEEISKPIPSMGLVCLPTCWLVLIVKCRQIYQSHGWLWVNMWWRWKPSSSEVVQYASGLNNGYLQSGVFRWQKPTGFWGAFFFGFPLKKCLVLGHTKVHFTQKTLPKIDIEPKNPKKKSFPKGGFLFQGSLIFQVPAVELQGSVTCKQADALLAMAFLFCCKPWWRW